MTQRCAVCPLELLLLRIITGLLGCVSDRAMICCNAAAMSQHGVLGHGTLFVVLAVPATPSKQILDMYAWHNFAGSCKL